MRLRGMVKKKVRGSDHVSAVGDVGSLVVEILCRLGCPKQATQCKLVCKFWCSLINVNPHNNSYLLRRWRQINYKQAIELPTILLTQYYHKHWFRGILRDRGGTYFRKVRHSIDNDDHRNFNLNFLPCRGPIYIVGSYNDVLLCRPYQRGDYFCDDPEDNDDGDDDSNCFYICNPFTKQWTVLLPPPVPTDIHSGVWFIVYDNDDDDDGFDFKLVLRTRRDPRWKTEVHMFSSSDHSGRWRKMEYDDECEYMLLRDIKEEVSCDGMVVLLIRDDVDEDDDEHEPGFTTSLFGLKFNQNDNDDKNSSSDCDDDDGKWNGKVSCDRLPLPLGYQTNCEGTLGVCQGRLRLAQVDAYGMKLKVWQFDSSRQEWDVVQDIDLNQVDHSAVGSIEETTVLALHPHDQNVLYLICSRCIFLCNLKEKRVELIRSIGETEDDEMYGFFPLVLPSWPTPVPRISPIATI